MYYTKTNWKTGDTITADKLNHIEDGIAEGSSGGNITFFPLTYDGTYYNTTASYNDVYQAMENGVVFFKSTLENTRISFRVITCRYEDKYMVTLENKESLYSLNPTDPLSSREDDGGDQPLT